MAIEFSVKYKDTELGKKPDWISIFEMPFGTFESFRRSFDHRDLTNLTVVKAEPARDGGEASCYAFEKFPNGTLDATCYGNAPETFYVTAPETFYVTKYRTSDVHKANRAIEKYWEGKIVESGPIESRLALPLEASDVSKIHRMLSVAVAGLGLVVNRASEREVLRAFPDEDVTVGCETASLAQWMGKLSRRDKAVSSLTV